MKFESKYTIFRMAAILFRIQYVKNLPVVFVSFRFWSRILSIADQRESIVNKSRYARPLTLTWTKIYRYTVYWSVAVLRMNLFYWLCCWMWEKKVFVGDRRPWCGLLANQESKVSNNIHEQWRQDGLRYFTNMAPYPHATRGVLISAVDQ